MKRDTWKPKPADYHAALLDQNPWCKKGAVPAALVHQTRRSMASVLWRAMLATPFRYQVVLGPRRVGKTVTMYQTIDSLIQEGGIASDRLWFLRLDHPLLMHYELGPWARSLIKNYKATPETPLFLFLDEVNYSKQWDRWLKTFFDEKWPLRVLATSSSTAALRGRTVESGIGRWSEQYLMPYTFSEFLVLRQQGAVPAAEHTDFLETIRSTIRARDHDSRFDRQLRTFLLIGGFPELLDSLRDDDLEGGLFRSQQVLRSEAVQRVAGMDIPQVFKIRNPLILERLLYILAGQICGVMNVSSLSTELGLERPTIHQYINYLEQAYLIFTLPNYSTSEESIQRKGRKAYFVDGAVRNAALQRGLAPMNDSTEWGILIENAAAAHLYALSLQSGARLFHWRDGQTEVDLVYDESNRPIAFEIAKRNHSLKGLVSLQARYPHFKNRCFLVTAESAQFNLPEEDEQGVGRLPLSSFLMAVGRHSVAALSRRLVL